MITLENKQTNPYFNLALEEYLLKNYDLQEDLFYLWRNSPSVIYGRNQNPFHEINLGYAHQNNIPVIRRISGGGTVIHDLGNINFTYITKSLDHLNDYAHFLLPIVSILNKLGIETAFIPKCHIYLNDKKISGNAQTFHKNRVLHHGTILFDLDKERASKLTKDQSFVTGKHIDSVRADITNIKNKIWVRDSIEDIMKFIQDEILLYDTKKVIKLTDDEINEINYLAENKYKTFEWNFGEMKPFEIKNHHIEMTVSKGKIIKSSIPELLDQSIDYDAVYNTLKNHSNKNEILKTIF